MPASLFAPNFQAILDRTKKTSGQDRGPFPSPEDWRDQWIYFVMVDRFNNRSALPRHQPFDDPNYFRFQGGKFLRCAATATLHQEARGWMGSARVVRLRRLQIAHSQDGRRVRICNMQHATCNCSATVKLLAPQH